MQGLAPCSTGQATQTALRRLPGETESDALREAKDLNHSIELCLKGP
jgi:hypothetical protein